MSQPHHLPGFPAVARWILCAVVTTVSATSLSAASHDVSPNSPLVIPISEVIGGTDARNNAKNNPNGGYCSVYDSIGQFTYPSTHGNQLGTTAMVNDHTYWDSSPGGLDYTHAPHADAGGGGALWWPIPGEWAAYQFNVTAAGIYTVLYRFSSSWGPGQPVIIHLTVDGVSSAPITLAPDDAHLWADTHYQTGGWWGHTMVSGTCPVAWSLGTGTHVLKVSIDSFPGKSTDHGNIWIHYFKILASSAAIKPPTQVLKAVMPATIIAANASLKQAGDHEQKGKLGLALAAYEKAAAGAQSGSESAERAAAKAKELRAQGEARLAAAKALPPTEIQAALKQLGEDYAGCDIGVTATRAAADSLASVTSTGGWTPPNRDQAGVSIKALVLGALDAHGVDATMTLFGKQQQVLVTAGDERALTIRLSGSAAGLEMPWERISVSDLAAIAKSCVKRSAGASLTLGECCITWQLRAQADEALNLAARLDPTLNSAVAQRLAALPASTSGH